MLSKIHLSIKIYFPPSIALHKKMKFSIKDFFITNFEPVYHEIFFSLNLFLHKGFITRFYMSNFTRIWSFNWMRGSSLCNIAGWKTPTSMKHYLVLGFKCKLQGVHSYQSRFFNLSEKKQKTTLRTLKSNIKLCWFSNSYLNFKIRLNISFVSPLLYLFTLLFI